MFERVGRSVAMLGGAAGLTFCLAGGVAVGLVPQVGSPAGPSVRTEASPAPDVTAAATPDTAATTTVAPEAPAPAPADPTPVVKPRTGTTQAAASSPDPEPAAAAVASTTAADSGPSTAARVNPSSAQVKAAIAQIGAGLPITEAQARDFGNQVCSAFDQGQSSAQVKATALQAAKKVPFVTVTSAQVSSAVSTAVQLFCPGYSSKV